MRKTASYYHEQTMNLLEVLDDHEEKTSSALGYGLGGAVLGGGAGYLSGDTTRSRVKRALIGAALGGGAGAIGGHYMSRTMNAHNQELRNIDEVAKKKIEAMEAASKARLGELTTAHKAKLNEMEKLFQKAEAPGTSKVEAIELYRRAVALLS